MATISAQITEELMAKADQRSEELYNRQNRSAYIVDLIKRDLEQKDLPIRKTDTNCFLNLANEFVDAISYDTAEEILQKRNIKQSHFLAHIIIQASLALGQLQKDQDWHEIKCTIPAIEYDGPDPHDPEVLKEKLKIEADMAREREKRKKAS